MTIRFRALAAAAIAGGAFLAPHGASGQSVVGRLPQDAVLKDLHDGQRIGPFVGWLVTGQDPVGVRAKSAPMVGLRYDVFVSNPFYFTARAFVAPSSHDVYLPAAPAANNRAGTASANQFGLEAGFEVALTGERSWRGVQPLVNMGVGLIAGAGNGFDAGGYKPGVSALYSFGVAARIPTGRNGELRADFGWMVHQVRYPNRFRSSMGDNPPLRPTGSLTPLTTDRAVTVGWTWGVFR